MPLPAPGPRASASWFASARIRVRRGLCVIPNGWRIGCMRPWRGAASRRGGGRQLPDEQRDRLADTLRLAEALGGEALTIPGVGRRIADDVVHFAQANNVTQIIIGKSTRSLWFELTRGSVVHDLVRRAGNISVNVIAGDELPSRPVAKTAVQTSA